MSELSSTAVPTVPLDHPRGLLGKVRVAVGGVVAAVLGAAPHVLHHAGPLAGAALFAGVGGTLLFGALGLIAAVPTLLALRRRTGSWRAPAGALALFATVFAISSFVVAPALSGGEESSTPAKPAATPQSAPSGHEAHHQ